MTYKKQLSWASLIILYSACGHTSILSLKEGLHETFLGGYFSSQGQSQHININGLIGDNYTVTDKHGSNGLIGLGYLLNSPFNYQNYQFAYGVEVFYLGKTPVQGNIIQEGLFTNLSYHYNVSHIPLYAAVKATSPELNNHYKVVFRGGIGPNFITTSNYKDHALNSFSIPDHLFKGTTSTTFSATAGVGIQIDSFIGKAPLEIAYRFYYLGQGQFVKQSNQVQNTLNTGNNYGNAVVCTLTF